MKRILAILILALVLALDWSALAQPAPINRRAMILSGLASAPNRFDLNFTGLVVSNRWLSATLNPTNAVSDWVDPTNNFHWTQTNSTYQPTNSALGVRFNKNGSGSEKFMDCTNVFRDGSLILYFIVRIDSDNSGGFNGICFDTVNGAPHEIEFQPSSGQLLVPGNFSFGKASMDVYQDYILDAGGGTPKVWTNGVQISPSSGTTWYSWNSGTKGIIGNASTHDYFAGYIAELIFFTNTTITSGQASNLHYYRTNVYGGSP